ncbi:hypothetical protein [Rhodoferax sp.]|uniref:hypothetical protein n=1 Tax=Rhodoferax sp. TaxID=50421 RepID=UPI0025F0247E|nr:hypothetical protein [Rhodoferax sp.]
MFAFLKKLLRTTPAPGNTLAASPSQRMDLEERKAYRKECLYQSIRETFLSMEVVSNMYRFKVMPVDERHHRFIAMVDVAKSFVAGAQARTKSFYAMEESMRTAAYQRYGVVIDGIYWRVSETEEPFERSARSSDTARPGGSVVAAQRAPVTPAKAGAPAATPLARHRYPAVSAEERAAFMAALQRGKAPPLVRVGEQEYLSDLMPLEGGGKTGGTQYGKL